MWETWQRGRHAGRGPKVWAWWAFHTTPLGHTQSPNHHATHEFQRNKCTEKKMSTCGRQGDAACMQDVTPKFGWHSWACPPHNTTWARPVLKLPCNARILTINYTEKKMGTCGGRGDAAGMQGVAHNFGWAWPHTTPLGHAQSPNHHATQQFQ